MYKPVPICEDKTYCENTLYYPSDIVSRELGKNPHLQDYATVDDVRKFHDRIHCLSNWIL